MLTPKEYAVDRGGAVCPNCESDKVFRLGSQFHDVRIIVPVHCTDCKAAWEDVYTLQYYDNLDLTDVED